MERFTKNEKTLIQNGNRAIFSNEVQCEDEIIKEIKEDPLFQTKKIESQKMMKKWKKN
jgi:hypothetical protein